MAKIFISHSWNDNDIAKKIADSLKRDGAEIWIDYAKVKGGDVLPERIIEAVDWCDTVVLIWSESAANSNWVKREWHSAVQMDITIIPCIIDTSPLPAILRGVLYIDFKNLDKGYKQLLDSIGLELKKQISSMAKVFISHSWNDNDAAKKIAHDLTRDGAEVWIDYARIKPGEGLPDRISQALEWCDTLVLVWSEAAAESYYIKLEWQSALDMQKKIIPCLFDNTSRPAILRGFLYIDFENFDAGYSRLCSSLEIRKEEELQEEASAIDEKLVNVMKSTATWETPDAETMVERNDIVFRQDYQRVHKTWRHWLKDKRFSISIISGMIIILLFVMLVIPIIREQSAWKKALQKNTVASYQIYLDSYPRGKYQVEATRRHEELVLVAKEDSFWDKAKSENKIQSYRVYLENYAQGRYADQAKLKIKDILGIDWIYIRGGTFDMGNTFRDSRINEKPVHSVTVSDFYMGRTEVTVGQFRKFVEETGYQTNAEKEGWPQELKSKKSYKVKSASWRKPGFNQNDDHPVVNVSWNDAVAFCHWAGCRLLTEAEWEYAARSDTKNENLAILIKLFKTILGDFAWYYKNSNRQTHPVAAKKSNALGLYDMVGNVWEWCSDWYDENYYKTSPQNNPKGPDSSPIGGRVLRGGSWFDDVKYCRSSSRICNYPDFWNYNRGFRVAQDSPQ